MRGRRLRPGFAVVALLALGGLARSQEVSPEASALRWALTYAPAEATPRPLIEDVEEASAVEGVGALTARTEPVRRAMLRLAAGEGPAADLARKKLAELQPHENEVERRGLDHAVPYLLTAGEIAQERLRKIGMHRESLERWAERSRSLRWLPALDRFQAWEPWGSDQAPLRFRDRDALRLAGTEGLVRLDGIVTVELWVRWPDAKSPQYLLTNEAWPGMTPQTTASHKGGFALRRNPKGNGTASLELVCAIAPDHWFEVESAPLRVTDAWEHVALCSDGRTIRLFRDGELVAARSIRGVRIHPGPGDLSIGVKEGSWPDRRANFDLRAFRIAEAAPYMNDFVPAQRLGTDPSALLALDFTPGGTSVGDLTGNGHTGSLQGPVWVPALDAGAVSSALGAIGRTAGRVSVFEADRGGWSADWYVAERDFQSEGVSAEIWSEDEPDAAGHWIAVPVEVPEAGRYRVHLVGPGLEHLGPDGRTSPFAWSIATSGWRMVTDPVVTLRGLGGHSMANLSSIGELDLPAGSDLFRLRVVARRPADNRYSFWFDAVVLEAVRRD